MTGIAEPRSSPLYFDYERHPLPAGNAPRKVKEDVMSLYFTVVRADDYEFAQSVVRRMAITEVSLVSKSEAPSRTESRVVCELPVASGNVPETSVWSPSAILTLRRKTWPMPGTSCTEGVPVIS